MIMHGHHIEFLLYLTSIIFYFPLLHIARGRLCARVRVCACAWVAGWVTNFLEDIPLCYELKNNPL